MVMRRILGTALLGLLALTAGCGDGDGAGAPASTEYEHVSMVSGTAAGGDVSTEATVLDGTADVRRYVEQFRGTMPRDVTRAVAKAEPPDGYDLAAAVVSIGCDVPPGVTVERTGDTIEIRPEEIASPRPECLAAVTTVALVAVAA